MLAHLATLATQPRRALLAVGICALTAAFLWLGLALPGEQNVEAAFLSEVKKLLASDAQAGDDFGYSVAVSGDTAVVGAWQEDAGGSNAGAAYVFQRNEGGQDNWGEVKKLAASDAQAFDQFGDSVALSGDTVVVGASQESAGGSNAGAAYVFQRDQGSQDNWGEVKKLTASDAEAQDGFGRVAVSGDTAVVGAFGEDAEGSNAGASYVIERDEGSQDNWGEVRKLTASDAEADDLFGGSVAVSGDTAVMGATFESTDRPGCRTCGFRAGAAYVFERDEGSQDNWGEVTKLAASDAQARDNFGTVAVSGDTAVVGAHGEGAGGFRAGAAYVFDLLLEKPTPTVTPTVCPPESCPVGGIALDSDLRSLPLETASSGRSPWGVALAIAAVASLAAMGGAAWYARRRRWLT